MGPIMMGPDEVVVGGDESEAAAARVRGRRAGRGGGAGAGLCAHLLVAGLAPTQFVSL